LYLFFHSIKPGFRLRIESFHLTTNSIKLGCQLLLLVSQLPAQSVDIPAEQVGISTDSRIYHYEQDQYADNHLIHSANKIKFRAVAGQENVIVDGDPQFSDQSSEFRHFEPVEKSKF